MLYVTHTYAAAKILGKDPLVMIGCTVPDIPLFFSTLDFKEMSTKGLEFREYVQEKDVSYLPLANGMMLHGDTPTGLDFYTHIMSNDKKPGYAFQNCQPLVEKIKKLHTIKLPFTDEEIAHNFIELGVELLVAKNHPETVKLFSDTIRKVDKKMIARHLSNYFSGVVNEQDIIEYYKLINPKKFSTLEGSLEIFPDMVARIFSKMADKTAHGLIPNELVDASSNILDDVIEKMVNKDTVKDLTLQAVKIVEPTYKEFLDKSIKSMKAEMSKLSLV